MDNNMKIKDGRSRKGLVITLTVFTIICIYCATSFITGKDERLLKKIEGTKQEGIELFEDGKYEQAREALKQYSYKKLTSDLEVDTIINCIDHYLKAEELFEEYKLDESLLELNYISPKASKYNIIEDINDLVKDINKIKETKRIEELIVLLDQMVERDTPSRMQILLDELKTLDIGTKETLKIRKYEKFIEKK